MSAEPAPHLRTAEVAGYVDGALTSSDNERVRAHLAECDECRAEVMAVHRLVRTQPLQRRSRILIPTALAAAAVAFVLIARFQGSESSTRPDIVRSDSVSADADAVVRIGVVEPHDGDTVPATRARFGWRALTADATYRFTLTDQSGRTVWTTSAPDTLVMLPSEITLQSGSSYFWYVDALRSDGRSATSGVHRVVVP